MTKELPRYRDLPRLDDVRSNHSWGVFGEADELGTLNLIGSREVIEATAAVRTGQRIPLSLPLNEPDPPLFNRKPYDHVMRQVGSMWDDRLDNFFPQGSSQWDGFRHHRVRQHGFYGGVTDDPAPGADRLSIHHWATQGVIGRGVLLDLPPHLGPDFRAHEERPITADEVRAVARDSGVTITPGDVLCLRTGWRGEYLGLDKAARTELSTNVRSFTSAGLRADEATAELLWDWHIAAVCADNPAVENTPGDPSVGSLHRRVLGMLGIPLGELFDFEMLNEVLNEQGRRDFLFVSVPLALVGGLGSPANAVAVL